MSRCRMVYCMGGESLNDVKKSERYKAPKIPLYDPTGEDTSDDWFAPAPGPDPARPQKPRYLQRQGKRRRLNPSVPNGIDLDQPGPSGINSNSTPNQTQQPTRVSTRRRKQPTRLIEE